MNKQMMKQLFDLEHREISLLESQYSKRSGRYILVRRVDGTVFDNLTVPIVHPHQLVRKDEESGSGQFGGQAA
ncbi:hypothetical protein GF324_09575 [bacterium]|nr:hypothetical protein [bacterium]